MHKTIISLVLALLTLGCQRQVWGPAPRPTPTPTPIVTPAPVEPTPTPPQPTPSVAVSRAQYAAITVGMSIDAAKAALRTDPILRVPQPDGGVNLRYPLLDTDGTWRGRHANLVFSVAGVLLRKSIS